LAQAGWLGLLVTSLNLIPLGQLDGGHIIYSLIGEKARKLFFPVLAILFALSLLAYDFWVIWIIMLVLLGRIYATPLDMITKLDRRRQIIAVVALIVFVLVFMPVPIMQIIVGR
jgi:membrane-associated protease RseP (regulator of RpoE activity)